MPDAIITRAALGRLRLAWISALCIVVFMVIAARALTYYALARENSDRTVADRVNTQELRTQRLLRNVVFLQSPSTTGAAIAPLVAALRADQGPWQRTGEAIYGTNAALGLMLSDFPHDAQARLLAARPKFVVMDAALAHMLALEGPQQNGATPEDVRPDAGTFFLAEPTYLAALLVAYDDQSAEADSIIATIQTIEWVLFAVTLIVLAGEAFFVVRVALDTLADQLRRFANLLIIPDDAVLPEASGPPPDVPPESVTEPPDGQEEKQAEEAEAREPPPPPDAPKDTVFPENERSSQSHASDASDPL